MEIVILIDKDVNTVRAVISSNMQWVNEWSAFCNGDDPNKIAIDDLDRNAKDIKSFCNNKVDVTAIRWIIVMTRLFSLPRLLYAFFQG